MAVYSHAVIAGMRDALINLVDGYVSRTAYTMTREEVIEVFVEPEDREIMTRAAQIADWNSTLAFSFPYEFELGRATVAVTTGSNLKVLVPKYASYGLRVADSAPRDRLLEWLGEAAKVRVAQGVAHLMLEWLNRTCGNAKAMQTMFPAVQTLMAKIPVNHLNGRYARQESDKNAQRATRIAETKAMGALPSLPPDLRRMVYNAGTLINVLGMADSAPIVTTPREGAHLMIIQQMLPPALTEYVRDHPNG